jgi:hypothetical protein
MRGHPLDWVWCFPQISLSLYRETSFNIDDLILRLIQKTDGMHKLSAHWEGPFIVTEVISPSTYRLQRGDGQGVLNPWNVEHLRQLYM